MKRNLLLVISGLLMSSLLMGQAKKFILFEHFTQASCPPCVPANEYFEPLFDANVASANHISYHTSFPGTDPMYSANSTEILAMQNFYSVPSVPRMAADGVDIGQPTAASQTMIDNAGSAPIRVVVREQEVSGGNRQVSVEVQSVGDVDVSKDYRLRVAVIEEHIQYNSPPGSNGETSFPNVFRKFIANGSDGIDINLAETGQSLSFDYQYAIESNWQAEEMYVIAYVQDKANSAVLNSGRSGGAGVEFSASSATTLAKQDPATSDEYRSNVFLNSGEQVRVTVTQDAPSDWAYILQVNGADANSGDEFAFVDGDNPLSLQIRAGNTAGVGTFTTKVDYLSTGLSQQVIYTVISNVTDLIVVTDNSPSTAIANGGNLTENYLEGIEATGNVNYGKIGATLLNPATMSAALEDVEHIYYSIGWTFPPLSDDMAQAVMDFLDRGGNLMIAGQDIGWAIKTVNSGFETDILTEFYDEYLTARFRGDGAPAQNKITFNTEDEIFGTLPEVDIAAVYGAANVYPEWISAIDNETGTSIWRYNNAQPGALRVENGHNRIVYLGVGLEMFADRAIADQVMQVTHDYFHSPPSSVEFVDAYGDLEITASPNPAETNLALTINNLKDQEFQIQIFNVFGTLVNELQTQQGQSTYDFDVSAYPNGLYFYQLNDGKLTSTAKKFMKH